MVLPVSDSASHRRDQIANLAELLANRATRQRLVRAVYYGKRKHKSVPFLAEKMNISGKRVTEIGKPLVDAFFEQGRAKENGKSVTVYVKKHFVQYNLQEILRLASDKKKFDAYHTKTSPKIRATGKTVTLKVPFVPNVRFITI